jgi:threonine synthase
MQLLGRMMNEVLEKGSARDHRWRNIRRYGRCRYRGLSRPETVVDVLILYPNGRVSDVQRRQMTTVTERNVHSIALQAHSTTPKISLRDFFVTLISARASDLQASIRLNWARVVAQMVYYFTSAVVLGAPHLRVSDAVPTGNFGDVFAGYVAKRMGLPIERLIASPPTLMIFSRAPSIMVDMSLLAWSPR